MLIFEVRLTRKELFVAIFDETRALTSRKFAVPQDMKILALTQKYKLLLSHPSVLFRIITSKILIF